jgi:hypothetical protein
MDLLTQFLDFLNSLGNDSLIRSLVPYIAPILVAILIGYFRYGPAELRMPASLPGIPLAFISVLIQIVLCVRNVLNTFEQIATQKSSGLGAIADGLSKSLQFFPRTFAMSVISVAAVMLFQVLFKRSDSEPVKRESSSWEIPRGVVIWTSVVVIAGTVLMWLLENTIDLVFLISDRTRSAEATRKLAGMDIGVLAGMISNHLLWTAGLSLALIIATFRYLQFVLQCGKVSNWIRASSWVISVFAIGSLSIAWIVYHHEMKYAVSLIPKDFY